MAGSKADVPKDLLDQIRKLEELFTVDTQKLKQITDHFINELAKGRSSIMFLSHSWRSNQNTRSQCGGW